MALKGQKTTTGFIQWNDLTNLVLKLQRDGEYKFSLLIGTGAFTGLRISDILSLTWNQLLDKDIIELHEMKTGKFRKIKINQDLQSLIKSTYIAMGEASIEQFVFVNKYGTKQINVQWVNTKLKEIFTKYSIKTENPSTHSLRKSFGRRIWEINNYSEKSLVLLSELFNHSNIQITKRYLGIKEKELFDVYDSLSI
ncbi:tyrosine-type recombinase/integrase [Flavobacterium sp. LB2P53]|uniref:tyrosine-type recombinase/integrase n=1 Tax=Flavobacterium sp. LB2P53 TaxID=2497481 RepID=UPI000F844668|nr:tyrosine-type recombinase/integrase [Flavobacterium sp. LB2P53]RTY65544.1 integrase [Flavobacterium sp. LB2P53]